MTYALGAKSLNNLNRVHPLLINVIKRAISISTQDFGVTEPQVRTLEYQKQLVARGVSKTLKSNHIELVDFTGKSKTLYGHAADLVPWVNGKFTWEWEYIWPIMAAMARASVDLGQPICSGAVWDRWMASYVGGSDAMRAASDAYIKRKGGRAFIDGPHYQCNKLG